MNQEKPDQDFAEKAKVFLGRAAAESATHAYIAVCDQTKRELYWHANRENFAVIASQIISRVCKEIGTGGCEFIIGNAGIQKITDAKADYPDDDGTAILRMLLLTIAEGIMLEDATLAANNAAESAAEAADLADDAADAAKEAATAARAAADASPSPAAESIAIASEKIADYTAEAAAEANKAAIRAKNDAASTKQQAGYDIEDAIAAVADPADAEAAAEQIDKMKKFEADAKKVKAVNDAANADADIAADLSALIREYKELKAQVKNSMEQPGYDRESCFGCQQPAEWIMNQMQVRISKYTNGNVRKIAEKAGMNPPEKYPNGKESRKWLLQHILAID